ncbi:MAG: aspartate kinase [Deltaproteobacteria bacterium]|nr:aspartate kinase [Deltaproteobacteria bacterium]
MPLVVQKYGGTSLATPELICSVARRVVEAKAHWGSIVVVVSAMGDATDELLALAKRVSSHPDPRELDMLMTVGERISMALLSMAIRDFGAKAISLTGSQCGIVTDTTHTNAKIVDIKGDRIREALQDDQIVIVAGFQGVSQSREITTLGRGGSDTTAVALAAALKADLCEILKDVDGVCTADPRRVPKARKVDFCSYDEMIELSIGGAAVIHPRAVDLARRYEVPLSVGSSFTRLPGTKIGPSQRRSSMESVHVRGITDHHSITKVTVTHIPEHINVSSDVLKSLSLAGIPVQSMARLPSEGGYYTLVLIVQSQHRPQISVQLGHVVQQWKGSKDNIHMWDVASVSIVGEGISSAPEISTKAFEVLAEAGVDIDMVTTSSLTITYIVDQDQVGPAVEALHRALCVQAGERPSDGEKVTPADQDVAGAS